MLNDAGFDRWADEYERSVRESEAADSYPFAGYSQVLKAVCAAIPAVEKPVILDLGFGTGALTTQLYERGCEIWGQDFSPRMLALSQQRMPEEVPPVAIHEESPRLAAVVEQCSPARQSCAR